MCDNQVVPVQPLHSSKNAKTSMRHLSILCGRIQLLKRARSTRRQLEKDLSVKKAANRNGVRSQALSMAQVEKSRKTHLNTRVEGGAAQSGRKIACGVDVINTGRSAETILTGCNYAGHCPK